jgi:hypothetical protein
MILKIVGIKIALYLKIVKIIPVQCLKIIIFI